MGVCGLSALIPQDTRLLCVVCCVLCVCVYFLAVARKYSPNILSGAHVSSLWAKEEDLVESCTCVQSHHAVIKLSDARSHALSVCLPFHPKCLKFNYRWLGPYHFWLQQEADL